MYGYVSGTIGRHRPVSFSSSFETIRMLSFANLSHSCHPYWICITVQVLSVAGFGANSIVGSAIGFLALRSDLSERRQQTALLAEKLNFKLKASIADRSPAYSSGITSTMALISKVDNFHWIYRHPRKCGSVCSVWLTQSNLHTPNRYIATHKATHKATRRDHTSDPGWRLQCDWLSNLLVANRIITSEKHLFTNLGSACV